MGLSTNSSSRAIRTGTISVLLLALVGTLSIPSAAFGHAGEVHAEPEPAASTPPSRPEPGSGKKGSGGAPKPTTERDVVAAQASRASSEAPPPPEVPDSDPALHFVLLGAVALLGAGLIFMRRRNALD